MTISVNGRGMTSESCEEKHETKHEFNYFIDRQLQNKLLQADDELLVENDTGDKTVIRSNIKSGKIVAKMDTKIDKGFGDFTGWFPDQKLVCRKLDGAKSEQKPRENTFIHPWRDYKRNREEGYAFKHYTDIKKYIEQYRKDHSCHINQTNRFSSGGLDRERRYAYPNPSVQQPPTQVQVQALWKGAPVSNPENPAFHYTNRKENLGTLVTTSQNSNSNCSCSRQNHAHTNPSSQAHRYKLVPSPFQRTNIAELKSPFGDSDNSSESGDSRTKTPKPRINSASSVTGRKCPTKISVPSQGVHNGIRPYPIQALTIQQSGIKNSDPGPPPVSSKPLDNLNVVAPEKQALMVERREVEPIVPSIQVNSVSNLLTSNEAPLRGYAVAKSPRPGRNDKRLHEHPDLEGLTWAEKLEFLRSVNKRPEKHKPKPQKLRFVKDEPDLLPTSEHEQLYEQRRIKHLVEQARMKGGKQYDWVNEAKVKMRGVDRNSEKSNTEPAEMLEDNSDCSSVGSTAGDEAGEERNFGKYGIYVPQKGAPQKLFDCHNITRSHTCLFSS